MHGVIPADAPPKCATGEVALRRSASTNYAVHAADDGRTASRSLLVIAATPDAVVATTTAAARGFSGTWRRQRCPKAAAMVADAGLCRRRHATDAISHLLRRQRRCRSGYPVARRASHSSHSINGGLEERALGLRAHNSRDTRRSARSYDGTHGSGDGSVTLPVGIRGLFRLTCKRRWWSERQRWRWR